MNFAKEVMFRRLSHIHSLPLMIEKRILLFGLIKREAEFCLADG